MRNTVVARGKEEIEVRSQELGIGSAVGLAVWAAIALQTHEFVFLEYSYFTVYLVSMATALHRFLFLMPNPA
jgi:hypothetical protein